MATKLVVIDGTQAGEEFPVTDLVCSIGTGEQARIRIDDEQLRAEHLELRKDGGVWRLRSTVGAEEIGVDGRQLSELRLEHGQRFRIGSTVLRFSSGRAAIERSPLAGKRFKDNDKVLGRLTAAVKRVRAEAGRIIIGQEAVLDQVLTAMFAQGHVLLVGAPGLAKTLLVRTLAGALDLEFKRIQFTPDLMPADITGTEILEEDQERGHRSFRFRPGPLFTNLLLADEINRTPPKTQAALLEAMQEKRVSAGGITHELPEPFLVLATQNPIEQEGTYPLPEAQLDRFMFEIRVDYPSEAEERKILMGTTGEVDWQIDRILQAETIQQFQHMVRQVLVSDHVVDYATALIRSSRPDDPTAPEFVRDWVRWGAGPRAGQFLLLAAKASAAMAGRFSVGVEDVRKHALPVLRHRIFTTFAAASEGIDTDEIVRRLVNAVPEPSYGEG